MARNYNEIGLMGRLVVEPEVKKITASGKEASVLNFSIAVDRTKEITDFIDCVAWNKTADFISAYFGKGDLILVRGSLCTRQYVHNDQKRKATEVKVEEAFFAGGKNKGGNAAISHPYTEDYGEVCDMDGEQCEAVTPY
ncbi:MAG: single-stranded DNA-binding protein [Bacteroides sp.]